MHTTQVCSSRFPSADFNKLTFGNFSSADGFYLSIVELLLFDFLGIVLPRKASGGLVQAGRKKRDYPNTIACYRNLSIGCTGACLCNRHDRGGSAIRCGDRCSVTTNWVAHVSFAQHVRCLMALPLLLFDLSCSPVRGPRLAPSYICMSHREGVDHPWANTSTNIATSM